jgi:catechol 2,3-dioxygenase-like lactoylglutathione lyase family enzyme
MTSMIKAQGVTHFSIPVRDLTEAEKFYQEIVGLEFRGRLGDSGMACVSVGEDNILLCETKDLPPAPTSADTGTSQVHHSFHFSRTDWEKGVRQLVDRGVTITHLEYREKGYFTGREVYFLDPSGNRLELRDPSWKPGMPKPTIEQIVAAAPAS